MNNASETSSYLKWLPAIFQTSLTNETDFLGRFLKAFEKILTGVADDFKYVGQPIPGISEQLDQIDTLFDPLETRADFLPWLASWAALTLEEGEQWDEARRRRLIRDLVPLYGKRGTPEGLAGYLKAYLGNEPGVHVSLSEFLEPMQVGAMILGSDTVVGEGRPYYFQVYLRVGSGDWLAIKKKLQMILDLVNREKPAYTYYLLIVKVSKMQIGIHSTVGVDTLTGGAEIVAQPNGRWFYQN